MSDETIKLIFGVLIVFILLVFAVVAIISNRENK